MTLEDRYTRPLAGSAALVLIDMQRVFYADDAPMRVEDTSAVRRSLQSYCPMLLSWNINCCWPVVCSRSELLST